MVKKLFFIFICMSFFLFPAEKWWNDNWKYRVKVSIKNPYQKNLKNIPVVITGEVLRKKTGLLKNKISTNSVRVIDNNSEIPVQVDEKDNTGIYQKEGNGQLDADDEIVFQVSLKPGEEKNFYIYFTEKLSPLPEYKTDLKFKKIVFMDMGRNYNAELSNSIISIGIRGAGKEKDKNGKLYFNGMGKASITSFAIKNTKIIYQGHSYGWFLGDSLISSLLPWSNPDLIIDGSVRKIAACKAKNIDINFTKLLKGQSWRLSGKVKGDYYRYFILYSKIPYCEVIEAVKIVEAEPKYNCQYRFCWCPTYPRDWENDVMYIPLAGKPITIKFQDDRSYMAKKAEEGWLAIANVKEKRGLGLFFDTRHATDIFAGFYARYLKKDDLMKNEWGRKYFHTEVTLFYTYDDFNLKKVRENRFGFYGVTDENGEVLRTIYKGIWKGFKISFGFPEENEK